MTMINQRRALRVTCELPVRIYGRASDLFGTLNDVSRMGVRLCVSLDSLGCDQGHDLLRLGHMVEQHLGARFNMDLNHDVLGPLVRKRLHVVRLGQGREDEGVLELGCEFGVPLSEDESKMLALDLPPLGTMPPAPVLTGPNASRRYEALLLPTEGFGNRMLSGRTHGLSNRMATFCANPSQGLKLRDREVSTMAMALAREYGPSPVLEIVDGRHQLWAGRAQIRHVESVATESNGLCLQVETFEKAPG